MKIIFDINLNQIQQKQQQHIQIMGQKRDMLKYG